METQNQSVQYPPPPPCTNLVWSVSLAMYYLHVMMPIKRYVIWNFSSNTSPPWIMKKSTNFWVLSWIVDEDLWQRLIDLLLQYNQTSITYQSLPIERVRQKIVWNPASTVASLHMDSSLKEMHGVNKWNGLELMFYGQFVPSDVIGAQNACNAWWWIDGLPMKSTGTKCWNTIV
jgi:hypothetical protein